MKDSTIHLLARWIEERSNGHLEDDKNIEILEELDSIFKVESKNPKFNYRMRQRVAYFSVIKRVIELQDSIR